MTNFNEESNWIVREYLELGGFENTVKSFDDELNKTNCQIDNESSPPTVCERIEKKKKELLHLFDVGQRQKFFEVWRQSIPNEMREENGSCRQLEFYLHIHFAVFPLRHTDKDQNDILHERMNHFKYFLETSGSQLSQTPEFLPYYALPFVPHPKLHPSFQDLFMENWIKDHRRRLESFLESSLKLGLQSRLSQLLSSEKSVQQQLQQAFNHIAELTQKLVSQQHHSKKIQEDYQKLIGLAAELIGSLELAVQGELRDVDPIVNLCTQSFPDIFGQTAAEPTPQQTIIQPLNMDRIRSDLRCGQPRSVALLLQALRWRLTKCKHWSQQVAILVSYIAADLMGCTHAGNHRRFMMTLVTSQLQDLCQSMARLVNAFACFREGRLYLAQSPELVGLLLDNLMQRKSDDVMLDMTLATLQKLSLRRNNQMMMIDSGMIEWLLGMLEDHDSLTDYSLEYAVALFMNLCLRSAGKHRCASNPRRVLKVLTDLLGNQNQEIVPYVNGALYSVLCVASVRKEAQAMAMEDILRCFIEEGNSEMRRQLEFILKQLSSDSTIEYDSDDESKDEEEEEDDDEEENKPNLEAELDRDDCVKAMGSELSGEDLLAAHYLLFPNNNNSKSKKNRLNSARADVLPCPVTPRIAKINDSKSMPPENERKSGSTEEPQAEKTSKTQQTKKQKKMAKKPINVTDSPESPVLETHEVTEETNDSSEDIDRNESETVDKIHMLKKSIDEVSQMQSSQNPAEPTTDEYAMAFSTRPRIPRTPDSSGRRSRNTPST